MKFQLARLDYQFRKLPGIREGIYPLCGDQVEHELYSFFEICYHLKDWIKNDPECTTFSPVEDYVNTSPPLRICADICNRLKHRTLNTRRSKESIGLFQIERTFRFTKNPNDDRVSIKNALIKTERGTECCFELANDCIEAWTTYLNQNGRDEYGEKI